MVFVFCVAFFFCSPKDLQDTNSNVDSQTPFSCNFSNNIPIPTETIAIFSPTYPWAQVSSSWAVFHHGKLPSTSTRFLLRPLNSNSPSLLTHTVE